MMSIEELKNYKPAVYTGPTSMISLIIPSNTNLDDIRAELKQEIATASNIKSNTNRKSVQQALSCVSSYVKRMKKLPETGIALYAEQYV